MSTPISDSPPSRREQLLHAVMTSGLFMLVYGGTSWITSLRAPVPTLYFEWEQWIPFLPWMVIPYMSIDAFFFFAPFLHRSRQDLGLFSRRITATILIAGLCFLLFPLQLAIPRPTASGWMGEIYNWFCTLDRPYNLCPSLHIALRTLLADVYARHTSGLLRISQHIWFSLIGFSTLTLYQHHVIDIVGGFVLAAACFYVLRPQPWKVPFERNPTVGGFYLVVWLCLLFMTFQFWPVSAWLLWPVVSVGILIMGYYVFGPAIFRKAYGQIPLSSQLVMAPVLFVQRLSLWYYARQCDPWNQVTDRVWIGRQLNEQAAQTAIRQGVTHVLDLTAEFSEALAFRQLNYHNIQVLDLTAPTSDQLSNAVALIDQSQQSGVIYVHCKIGYSRSAAVICAWLISSGKAASVEESIQQLRAIRPAVVIRPEILRALQSWCSQRPSQSATTMS